MTKKTIKIPRIQPQATGQVLLGMLGGFVAAVMFQGFGPPFMLLILGTVAGVSTATQAIREMRAAKMRRERFNEGIPSAERNARLKFGFGSSFAFFSVLGIVAFFGSTHRKSMTHPTSKVTREAARELQDSPDWREAVHASGARPEAIGIAVLLFGIISGTVLIYLGLQKAKKPETLKQGYLFAAAGIFDLLACAFVYRILS